MHPVQARHARRPAPRANRWLEQPPFERQFLVGGGGHLGQMDVVVLPRDGMAGAE